MGERGIDAPFDVRTGRHRHPFAAAGNEHEPTEPGERCILWLPWLAPWPLKL